MTFSERLAELRKARGLTQTELAKLVNVSQPTVANYERGKITPFKNTQLQLAKVLKVSVDELMRDEERGTE